ncbi:MAG: SLC13 family permease [Phycisphaerales bacterium]|nr:SLC13 family permease [Phycisphaerales bacterium]
MTWETWYTLAVVGLLVAALVSNRVGTDTAMLGALTLIMLAGIIEPAKAVAGFADPSVLMIAALFVVACGLSETGATVAIAQRLLGRPKGGISARFRLMIPVATMSAFMNNTPIVAMYLPIVHDWARKLRLSPSRLFMPLSFAAIMGGACTLIGTSTNIAVNQLYLNYYNANGDHLSSAFGLGAPSAAKQFWWIAVVGGPAAVIGVVFVAIGGRWLLPQRVPPDSGEVERRRYTVEMVVEQGSPIVGRSVEQAGLRHLPGLFLTEIERDGNLLQAVGPEEILEARDLLIFVGVVDSVADLLKIRGLSPATDQVKKVDTDRHTRTLVEAVVSHSSPLVRRRVRETQFRTRYNAAIIAVHRGGERVEGKIGDIVLQPGDTLLLSTHSGFLPAYRNSDHFYLVSGVEGAREVFHERAGLALVIMALLVLLMTMPSARIFGALNQAMGWSLPKAGIMPLTAAFVCATLMVWTRCCTGTLARRSINWQVLMVIGAAIGVGKAMDASGAARAIADVIFSACGGVGPRGLLFVFSLLTAVLCQLVTNKGAAVLMFPIATALAAQANGGRGLSPEPFVVTLMATAASSYMTPVGFVTNLMVYGPGGYRFTDYLRLGVPLTLMVAALCALLAPAAFPFLPGG